ncbi:hypothetical protein [Limosilactobacillus ingluviei]|nr:hypothetical protein [Limosilactobacillus ingluviei]
MLVSPIIPANMLGNARVNRRANCTHTKKPPNGDDQQEEYAQREFEGAIDHGQSKAKPYWRQKKDRKVEQLPAWAADDYQPETGQVTQEEADRLGDLINDVAAKKDTDPDRPQWLDDDVPF